jgi:hypothetical protein
MHGREMARVFVDRPLAGGRPPFQESGGDFPDERHYDLRSSLEGVNDTLN